MAHRQAASVSILRRNITTNGHLSFIPAMLGMMLFAEFFLPRFALHLGQRELSIAALVTFGCVAMLVLVGGLRPDPTRAGLFCLAMASMLVSVLLSGGGVTTRVSAPSFLLLVCMYMAYVFVIPDGEATFDATLRLFRRFALIVTIAGICQFVAQVVIPGPTLFTFADYLPDAILTQNFNDVIPVPGAEELNKSNGFFLLEPSHFSQLVGLAVVAEMAFFRPSWRLAVLGLGLLLSYSGTGLVICAVFVPLLLVHRGHGRLVLVSLAIAFALLVFADLLYLTSMFERLNEFGSEQSSAFARFLSPFYLFNDFVFPQVQTTLFGLGPGSIEPYFRSEDYAVHDPTWGKVFFEYGLVGTIPFMVFVCHCMFAGTRSYWLSAALFFTYLLLGGNLLEPRMESLILVLVVFQNTPRQTMRAAPAYHFQSFEPRRP
jgi:hypothetical protein